MGSNVKASAIVKRQFRFPLATFGLPAAFVRRHLVGDNYISRCAGGVRFCFAFFACSAR